VLLTPVTVLISNFLRRFRGVRWRVSGNIRPTSTYCARMRVRCYFSSSTEVGGDILFIDQALAAGGAAFRRSARARLSNRLAQSKPLVLGTHSMSIVRGLCDRVELVADARILEDGEPESVIRR